MAVMINTNSTQFYYGIVVENAIKWYFLKETTTRPHISKDSTHTVIIKFTKPKTTETLSFLLFGIILKTEIILEPHERSVMREKVYFNESMRRRHTDCLLLILDLIITLWSYSSSKLIYLQSVKSSHFPPGNHPRCK